MVKNPIVAAVFALLSGIAAAQDEPAPLLVGDPAPPIPAVRWVGGEPVGSWNEGHLYVLDFWATWCPPCIEGLRRLQTLHERLADRDVHVIAIAIWSTSGPKPPEQVLARFPELGYSLAIDREDAAAAAFMATTLSTGLPNTMIVDRKGRLAWVGDPSSGFEEALDAIVAGRYDIGTARQADAVRHRAELFIGKASQAERGGEFRSAIELIEQAIAVDPDRFSAYRGWQYEIALLRLEDGPAAQQIAERLLTSPQGDDPYPLFVLATRIVNNYEHTPPDLRDPELALRCASAAVDNHPNPDYDSLALLARVHALLGQYGTAEKVQAQAEAIAPEVDAESAQKALHEYQALAGSH